MKTTLKLLSLSVIAAAFMVSPAMAAGKASAKKATLADDIDSLGGNQELMEMAQNIKSQTRTRIVQDRIVERRNRVEFGVSYGSVFGGDSYVKTQSLGLAADYHITPRWSLGVRYYDYGNKLTDEGQRIFDQAKKNYEAGGRAYAVDIDYPENAALAVVNWYPIYGKTSFLDMGVTQFDIYLLAGGGQMTLSSGTTSLMTAGAGVGAWITKHISARAEMRYQTYKDQPVTGSRSLDTVVGSLGIGFIL
ncbi:outer membrane beta-barrel domain-containing protein [Bdellovibrio bacteriovorus]|uniref:outer membrane beta-barrel domain-containing protein n=1 Tax=Bdellovibrio bacteriovorus TaxID=959 RepID=UPI0021CFA817|nr:outer membrane beta-barrel domain-containing protein [Bdellovibrio bacteriovorus]UXR65360.1 outer membrane beta-barrel domain-containing protein [Bdellovibrio bacteriovorus]